MIVKFKHASLIRESNLPFVLITLSVFIALIVPSLIQDGMFMDGMIYSTVSKNLANGLGTLWNMHLNQSLLSSYHDQPPLTLWIEAGFFKVFGNSLYTERIFSFVNAILTALMMAMLWRKIFQSNHSLQSAWWLPVLLWVSVPVVFWSYSNNMQENTMSVFVLLTAWIIIHAIEKNNIRMMVMAGILVFLSSMTKGIQGTFPVVFPVLYSMVFRKPGILRSAWFSLIALLIPILIYGIILQHEVIRKSFADYIQARLVHTFRYDDPDIKGRFYLLRKLLMELLVPGILCLILFIVFRFRKYEFKPEKKVFVFFLLAGLSGTLPLLVTLEQRGFYLVTVMPFYAIALASLIAHPVSAMESHCYSKTAGYRRLVIVASLVFIISIIVSAMQTGKTRRDHDMLHDVYAIGNILPSGSVIGVKKSLWTEWSLHMYFSRYFNITPDADASKNYEYFLLENGDSLPGADQFTPMDIGLVRFKLYHRKD